MHKILYLSPSATLLGARRSLMFLLEQLDKSKFIPIVACSKNGDLLKELRERKIKTVILRFHGWRKLRNLKYAPSTIISLLKLIKNEKVELIHCNEFWLNPYGVISAKIAGIPCISHVRTGLNEKKIKNYLLAHSNKIIAVSDETRKPIRKFPKIFGKTIVVYNGVDTKKFNPNIEVRGLKKEFDIGSDEIVVGTIGQLYPDKGQKTFIEAANIVLEKYPKTKFLIVGEAKKEIYKTQLTEIVDNLKLQNKIIFTGKRDDIPQIMSVLDIFALPTLNEGFARVIIEAMACSKPVIATFVGGNSEAVVNGETGFIIPINSPDILARRIIELIENETLRKKMGVTARERVVNNFGLEHYVNGIEKVYEEFLQ